MPSGSNLISPSRHPLDGCYAKLERADQHLESLQAAHARHIDGEPHYAKARIDQEVSRFRATFHVQREPPLELSVILGDFVHNLRSALDHLVWQLVILSGNEPIDGAGGNQFPIAERKPGDLRKRNAPFNRRLRGVHRSIRAYINRLQPYHAGEVAHLRPLAVLASLSNEDKHRAVLPSYVAIPADPDGPYLEFVGYQDVERFEVIHVSGNTPLRDGDEFLWADVRITGPNPRIHMRGTIPVELAFGKIMMPLSNLTPMRDAVREVISSSAPLFENPVQSPTTLPG